MTVASVAPARSALAQRLTQSSAFLQRSVHDPGHVSLRRGLRAAVVLPILLASASVLGVGPALSTFLVFGAMSLLVLADFGGPTRRRLLAYFTTAVLGVPLIVIGTLASANVATAVAATLAVGFVIAASAVLGGSFATAQTALLLSFVLAVATASPIDTLIPRELGWCIAGAIALFAAWLLWPRSSHVALRRDAASAVRAVSAIIQAPDQGASVASVERLEAEARADLAALRTGFVVAQRRPAGATQRDRALAELATDLARAVEFAASAARADRHPPQAESGNLTAAIASALDASAALLDSSGPTCDVEQLVVARDAHRAALDAWVAQQLGAGAAPESILDGLEAAHPLWVMSYVALTTAQHAEIVAGLAPTGPEVDVVRRDLWSTLREELTPSSIWLRNSVRTAVGLAVAVLVERSLAVSYAFWVVLGTLSALRSNASATGRTALQALAGTALGVLIAVPLVGATGGSPWLLWVVLPVLVFLAAYTPAAVHFVVGQAAFSMLVVVLFNILAPSDWQLGLVRIEDAALGVGVSAGVGLMLWPRGARGQLRSALATLYSADATYLSASLRRMLGAGGDGPDETRALRSVAQTEAIRAEEVFDLFLNERGTQVPPVEVWAMLLSSGKRLLLIGAILDSMFERGYAANASVGDSATVVGNLANDILAHVVRLADEIHDGRLLRVTPAHAGLPARRTAALAALSVPGLATSPEAMRAAIGLVTTAEWLGQLEELATLLEAPVAEASAAARRPWWR